MGWLKRFYNRLRGRGFEDEVFDLDDMTSESSVDIEQQGRSLADLLLFRKPEEKPDEEKKISTAQRRIDDIIDEYIRVKSEAGGKFLKYMKRKGWDLEEIINAGMLFEQTIFKDNAQPPEESLRLLHRVIKSGVLKEQNYAVEYPDGTKGPVGSSFQLKLVLYALNRMIASSVPAWAYRNIISEWVGNKEAYKNSDRFALDFFQAVSDPSRKDDKSGSLALAGLMSRQQRDLLITINDRLTRSSLLRYGNKFSVMCTGILNANERTPQKAYELCEKFLEKDTKFEVPEMCGSLLSLPDETPRRTFQFIEDAINRILSDDKTGMSVKWYAESLENYVSQISKKLSDVGLAPQMDDNPERFLQNWYKLSELATKYGNFGMFRREDISFLLAQADFDAKTYIEKCLNELKQLDLNMSSMTSGYKPEAPHFEFLLDRLHDANPLESMVFAMAHMKAVKGELLRPFEQRWYDELVSKAYARNTDLREDQRKLVDIVVDRRNTKDVPPHVAEYYRLQYGVKVSGRMLDLGKDNNAWYRFRSSVEGYQALNGEGQGEDRVDKGFISRIVWHLNRHGQLGMRDILLAGLACGDGWKEIAMYLEIKDRQRLKDGRPFNVWLNMYDKNSEMIARARRNCNSKRIAASTYRRDIMEMNYETDFSGFERQLIFFLGGRTPFNFGDDFNRLLDSLLMISLKHFTEKVPKPAIILIEGAESTNMEHYWDRNAIQLHSEYLLRRLEMDRNVIYFDKSITQPITLPLTVIGESAETTYAAIQTPEKDSVEFYFVALRDTPILGGKHMLHANEVIRCGESRLMSPEIYASLKDRFIWEVIRNDNDANNMFLKLIPDYEKLLGTERQAELPFKLLMPQTEEK
jgi:hypothetical protein